MQTIETVLKNISGTLSRTVEWLMKNKLARLSSSSSKKRILIDCTGIKNTLKSHGIQRVVQNYAKNLSLLAKEYSVEMQPVELYETFIIAKPLSDCDGNTIEKTKHLNLAEKIYHRLKYYVYLYKNVIRSNKQDILLCLNHFPYKKHKALEYFKKKSQGTVIYMIHDLIPINYPQFCESDGNKNFFTWLESTLYVADAYICVSKTTENELNQFIIKKGFDPSSYFISHVRLGSHFSHRISIQTNIRPLFKELFIRQSPVYLIVSTIEPRKNHAYLIDTFELLWKNNIDATLLIIGGRGWMVKNLLERITTHTEYGKRLIMINNANDQEVAYSYAHAKALVFPSFIEGFGLPIIESLSMGLPVLASDTAIHREVGGEDVSYFDIRQEHVLYTLIQAIEKKSYLLKVPASSSSLSMTWRESTLQLLNKISIFLKQN